MNSKDIFRNRQKNRFENLKSKNASGVYSTAQKVLDIEIGKIEESPYQPRMDYDEEKMQELTNSLKEHGLLQPIIVRKLESGKYQIIAGHRRYLAAKRLGWEDIKAIVKNDLDENDIGVNSLIENLHRDDLSPYEIALSLFEIQKAKNYKTYDELAKGVGFGSAAKIFKYLSFLKLPQKIQDIIKNGGYSNVEVISHLGSLKDEKLMLDAYKKISSSDMNQKEAIAFIKKLKKPETKERARPLEKIRKKGFSFVLDNNKAKINIAFEKLEDKKRKEVERLLEKLKEIFEK